MFKLHLRCDKPQAVTTPCLKLFWRWWQLEQSGWEVAGKWKGRCGRGCGCGHDVEKNAGLQDLAGNGPTYELV